MSTDSPRRVWKQPVAHTDKPWVGRRPRMGFAPPPFTSHCEEVRFKTHRQAVRWVLRASDPFGAS